jgi:hypothetical protein
MGTEVEVVGKEAQPSFLSWKWIKLFFRGMRMDKYDAEKWGVYNWSSACTWIFSSLVFWIKYTGWPLIVSGVKAVVLKVLAFLAACKVVIAHMV